MLLHTSIAKTASLILRITVHKSMKRTLCRTAFKEARQFQVISSTVAMYGFVRSASHNTNIADNTVVFLRLLLRQRLVAVHLTNTDITTLYNSSNSPYGNHGCCCCCPLLTAILNFSKPLTVLSDTFIDHNELLHSCSSVLPPASHSHDADTGYSNNSTWCTHISN
jgi:hypothetical protein